MLREELLSTMSGAEVVVMDCGTSQSRIGFASNPQPHTVMPTVVGRPRLELRKQSSPEAATYVVGEEAESLRGTLSVKYPVEYGCITNWEDMERVWHTLIFDKLRTRPEEHPFFLVEHPHTPRANREKTAQILFETYNVPSLCMKSSPETSLLASGRTTGMVVDIGAGLCTPAPVFEGYVLSRSVMKTLIDGRDLTYYMLKLLADKQALDFSLCNSQVARSIKEQLCYVAFDYEEELRTFSCQQEKQYQTPEGHTITVGKERFQCPESIFQPQLRGLEMSGLHEIIFNSISRCEEDIRPCLYANVLLCGGSALFPGLAARLEKELSLLAGPKHRVQVTVSPNIHAAFRGATMLASREDFLYRSLSKDFYDEYGPSAVERIFFQY